MLGGVNCNEGAVHTSTVFVFYLVQGARVTQTKWSKAHQGQEPTLQAICKLEEPDEFCKVFQEKVFPYINQESGVLQEPSTVSILLVESFHLTQHCAD